MRSDTPPPEDDSLSEDIPSGIDDIEIIEEFEIEDVGTFVDEPSEDLDEARLTFSGHSGSVFCCALDKTGQYAVTGGQDDKGYVWNPRTGEVVLECKGHKDSVFCAGFSYDSKYVATADLSGVVQVWNFVNGGSTVFDTDLMGDLGLLEWNVSCNVLFAGAVDGNCWMWHIPSGQTKVFHGTGVACSNGKIMPSGLVYVVGHDDGSIRFLDLKAGVTKHTISGHFSHEGPITTVDCHNDNTLVITGSTDGTAKVIKATDGRVLFTLRCEPEDLENKSVESAQFFASHPLIATGTVCGSLAIWDIPTQVRRLQCEQEAGITKLICDSSAPMVYTAGVDGVVRLMDGRTGQHEKVWAGHTSAVHDFVLSSDGSTILTCSDDGTCKVFDTRT